MPVSDRRLNRRNGAIVVMDILFWKDVALDTGVDALRIFPFLLVTYILMEYLEHHTGEKTLGWLEHAGPLGPVFGALLGALPQCGFSAAASNLYAARVISMGSLIAVYLSTSDEMLPLLISTQAPPITIARILFAKALIGFVAGIVIDLVLRKLEKAEPVKKKVDDGTGQNAAAEPIDGGNDKHSHEHGNHIHEMCEREHCDCDKDGIFVSALKHSLKVLLFVVIISFLMNAFMAYIGIQGIKYVTIGQSYAVIVLASLFGLIPNCGVSVALTQLYMGGVIGEGAVMAGLLVGAGVGLLVLVRVNRPFKDTAKVIALLWLIGLASGCLIRALGITFV